MLLHGCSPRNVTSSDVKRKKILKGSYPLIRTGEEEEEDPRHNSLIVYLWLNYSFLSLPNFFYRISIYQTKTRISLNNTRKQLI